jgi:hypothetical protein
LRTTDLIRLVRRSLALHPPPLAPGTTRTARRDQFSEAAEKVAQHEYDQSSGDWLRANHFPYFADATRDPARCIANPLCCLMNAARNSLRCVLD